MLKYLPIPVMIAFTSTVFAADKAMHEGGGGPTPLDYKMTEQAAAEYQRSGDTSGYDNAEKAAEAEKTRKAFSKALPEATDHKPT